MTTIAYKDGVIAFDSRITNSGIIINDNAKKYYMEGGKTFFYSGAESDIDRLIDGYLHGLIKLEHGVDGNAIVIDTSGLYFVGVTEDFELWSNSVDAEIPFAIGSGRDFALAFMDAGMSAVDAVKMTAKRDIYTGGAIRSYELKSGHIKTHQENHK
jgi:20S proteasome alpha/beta subunit